MYLLTTRNFEITDRYISTSILKMENKMHQFLESLSIDTDHIQHYQTIARKLKKNRRYECSIQNTQIIIEKLEKL